MGRRTHAIPKYMTIYEYYKEQIVLGHIMPHEKLSSENEICHKFAVSRITVVKALDMLTMEGYIYRIQGGGTFVSEHKPAENAAVQPSHQVKFISLITAFQPTGKELALIQSIENVISSTDYLLSVSNSNDDYETEKKLIQKIKGKASGIILYMSRSRDSKLYYELFKQDYPIVFVDKHPFNLPCNFVVSDNFDGGYQIGKQLAKMGHKRMALLFHELKDFSSEFDRYMGFMKAMEEDAIARSCIQLLTIEQPNEILPEAVIDSMVALTKGSNPVTAVFACNDILAMQAIERFRQYRPDAMDTVTFAGFDGTQVPPLDVSFLTVKQDAYRIGESAANILLDWINNGESYLHEVLVPVELVTDYILQPTI